MFATSTSSRNNFWKVCGSSRSLSHAIVSVMETNIQLRPFPYSRGCWTIIFFSKYVEYIVKIHQIKQKKVGQTRFVWAVENGTFLALLTHIGVFHNNLGVLKPFECSNVYLKSKGNFRASFHNFRAISLRFRIDGGKHVVPTSLPSFYPILLKNW